MAESLASEDRWPQLGHAMLPQFCFPPGFVNLNNGSYGSLPLPVLKATEALALKAEESPDKFIRKTAVELLNTVRARVARLVKAETDECVIIPNATHGVSTILMNLDWKEGDVIVQFTTTYGAVQRAIRSIVDRYAGMTLKTIPLTYPISHAALRALFISELSALARHEGQTVVAIIDGIQSKPGVRMPWEELVKICKERNVLSLVDGAHLIGQIEVNLSATQPDFWVSNCHKWLSSKRPSAVLYVPYRNQHLIKLSLPVSIGYVSPGDPLPVLSGAKRFVHLFEYTGTSDQVPFLSIGPALDFRESLGGEERINEYCHSLAIEGGKCLAHVLGTRVLDETGELTANMTNVLLPMSPPFRLNRDEMRELVFDMCDELIDENKCMVNLYVHDDKWWARCSAQVWNEISDFEYAGKVLLQLCAKYDKGSRTSHAT